MPSCKQLRAAAANHLKITRVVPTAAPAQATVHIAPGILYDMPRVTSPLMGERMHGATPPLITWDAEPLKHPNDYYALYIQHLKGWNVACYKAKQGYAPEWLPGVEPHHGFGVYVIILRSPTQVAEGAYCTGDPVSPSTEPWTVFFWAFQ